MFSLIIPTLREKENLEVLIPKIGEKMKGREYEIIIVDDNSQDGTTELINEFSKKYPCRIIVRKNERGLTGAVLCGVTKSKGNDIIVMDADLSHPPETLLKIAEELKNYEVVVASRNITGGSVDGAWPVHRHIMSKGATTLAKLILKTPSTDPMSGFFGVKKEVFTNTKFVVRGYKLLLNILAKNKLRIKEIPYHFKDRYKGETKLDWKENVRFVRDYMKIITS